MNAHLDELLVDALLDEDPGAVGADLALRPRFPDGKI